MRSDSEVIVLASAVFGTDWIAHTIFCRVLRMDGVLQRTLITSEMEIDRYRWSLGEPGARRRKRTTCR